MGSGATHSLLNRKGITASPLHPHTPPTPPQLRCGRRKTITSEVCSNGIAGTAEKGDHTQISPSRKRQALDLNSKGGM